LGGEPAAAPKPSSGPVTTPVPAHLLQQSEIPKLSSTRFEAMYPGAEKVTWTSNAGAYEASFTFKQTAFHVLFLADGAVERTKTKSDVASLPQAVSSYASSQLKGKSIKEVMRVVDGIDVIT